MLPTEEQDENSEQPSEPPYRVAAITGAGSGIGRALAAGLSLRGFDLALSDISPEGLEDTRSSIANTGVQVLTTVVDVADRQAMESWAQEIINLFGQVNWVFNNAGVTVVDSAEHISMENFHWLMDINFWGVVNGTQVFLPHLKNANEAHIINTSSIFGVVAAAGQSAYNASKFAVRGFTEALAQELSSTHVKVSCVMPGGVRTSILDNSRYYATDNESPTQEEASERFRHNVGLLPHQAAQEILAGVANNESHILVGNDAKMLALSQRLAPRKYAATLRWFSRILGPKPKDDD